MHWLGEIAETWVPTLFFLGILLMLLPRVRGLGALLFGVGLFLYVATIAGAYTTAQGIPLLQWMGATSQWANSAPKPEPQIYTALAVEGDGIALLRYNATVRLSQVREAILELNKSAYPIPLVNNTTLKYALDFFSSLAKNGSDWVAAGWWAPTLVGVKNWTGLNQSRTYIVHTWLDVPRPVEILYWCPDYSMLEPYYRAAVGNATIGNVSAQEWMDRMKEAECQYYKKLLPWAKIYAGPQSFWRMLTTDVNVTVVYNNKTLLNESRIGYVGVWGWLVPPASEVYKGGNVTVKRGVLRYDVGLNATNYTKPAARPAESNFTILVPNAGKPQKGGSQDFYKWTRVCEWCCVWTCDPNGQCWCDEWCSTSREEWEEPRYEKVLKPSAAALSALSYRRPWVPENRSDAVLPIPFTYRDWRVWAEEKYGPWSNGPPPAGASCRIENKHVYKRIIFWDVQRNFAYVYGFAWLGGVELSVNPQSVQLPDTYDEAPTSEDGVELINLLRGAEYDQECSTFVLSADEPRWRLVPLAVQNMTRVNRDLFFALLAAGNYSRAYLDFLKWLAPNVSDIEPTASVWRYYYGAIKPRPLHPMPEVTPRGYTPYNFYVACVRFDWRPVGVDNVKKAYGRVVLYPGNSTWLVHYPMGDSNTTRKLIGVWIQRWRWIMNNPPPPPPKELAAYWPIPWNGSVPLTYKPADTPPMPKPDKRWGVSIWDVGFTLNLRWAVSEIWGRLFVALFVAVFAPVVVLEVLSAVFGFPSFGQYLMRLAVYVVQDLAFWFQIRLLLRSKWFTRLARFMSSPVKRASVRLVRRLALKGAVIAKRYRDSAREYVERRFGIHPDAVNEQVRRRIEEAIWQRLRQMEEALVKGGRKAAEAASKAAREAYRVAKTVHEYTRGDLIHLLRRISPKVDYAIDALMDEVARRHPWLYYTLLWHLDDKPRWLALINPAYIRRLYLEGRITREKYEELMALREYLLARRAAAKARAVAERVEEFAVAQKMREIEREAVQRSRQAYMELLRKLAVKDWEREIAKSVEELMRGGAPREEAVRRAVSEVVGDVERLVRGVYEPFLELHMGASAKFSAFFRQITGVEPKTAREAAELLVGARVEGERVVVDPSVRVRFLRSAEQFWALWEEYWLSRPVPYDARKFARAVAVDEVRASLPTLRTVAVARAVAIGAVRPEEAEKMLRPPVKELTLGAEEYVGRATPLERGVSIKPYVSREGLAERLALLRAERMAESAYRDVYVVSALAPMAAEPWAVKLLEKAVKAVKEGDEKARREVLRESFEFFRRFGAEHSWLAYMRRVYAVEKPEAVEVLKAFERAVKTALSGDREGAVRQFKTDVEKLKEFYAARGGESAVRTIERLEKEYVKLLEKVKPEVLRDLAPVEHSAREAQRLRAVLERLSDVRAAREGWELFREGDVGAAGLSLLYRELVERVREAAARHRAVVEASSEAREVVRQYESLRPLLRKYVEASPAERGRLEAAVLQTAEALRRRVEAVGERLRVAEAPPEFYVKLAEAYIQLYRMRVVDREERLRVASQIGEELRKTYSTRPLAEFWMPDPLLYAIAAEHRRLVEELRAAKAAGGTEAVRRIAAELSALVELAHRHASAREIAEVFKAVYQGKMPYVVVREAHYDVALRLWQTAERAAALEKVKRDVSKELEPLRKVEVRLPGYREALERVQRLVSEAEALARAGRYAEAEGLMTQAKSLAEALNRVEKAVGARSTKIEAPSDVALYLDAWTAVRLSATASLLYTEGERRALVNALRELYRGRGRELAEAVAAVRREYEPYFTTVRLLGREAEVPVFKQPTVPAEVFERALAVVLLAELARREKSVAEHVGKRIEAIALNALEELSLRAGVGEAKRIWAKALREAREALQPPFAKLSTGDADVLALRKAAEAVLEVAGRLGVRTKAVEAAVELTRPGAAEAVVKYFKTLEEFRKTQDRAREEELRRLGQEAPAAISLLQKAGARPGEEAVRLVETFRREALEATTAELAKLRAELEKYLDPDSARLLIKIASISPSAAEAALALQSVRDVVGGAKDVERARAVLREYVKALEAYPRLVEYLRSPVLGERELAYVIWAAERLGLKNASEMLKALGRAYELFDAYGRERLYSPLYDQLLPYLGWEPERALLRAPPAVYVVNRLGEFAGRVFARYPVFTELKDVVGDVAVQADVPLRVGMPTYVFRRPRIRLVEEEVSGRHYPDRVARFVAKWDWGGVREGIQRYMRTAEGRRHRALAELLARGGVALALEEAAYALKGKAPEVVVTALLARAAREEAALAKAAEKVDRDRARVVAEGAAKKYSRYVKQLREALMNIDREKAEELRRWFGPGALSLVRLDPEEAVSRLVKWSTPERALAWLIDLKLEGVADTVAKSIEAYRIYKRFERWMEPKRGYVREGGVLSVAKALDVEARYQPSRLEDAVVRSVSKWASQRVKRLEEEVGRIASQLARHHAEGRIELPSAVAQWLAERGYYDLGRMLKEVQPAEEAYRVYKEAVRGVVEELKAVAKFSPGAKHEVERVAREWYGEGGLRRYVAVIALQELARIEPARAREAALYRQLPEELRRMAEAEVADVERALVKEGFYDSALRPVWRALWLREREGRDPREYAERLIARIEALAGRGDLPDEVAERAVSALRQLVVTPLDDPLLYERAVKAGDAVADAAAYLVWTSALGLGYSATELLRKAAEAVGRIAKSRELLLEAIYRAMDRDVAEALETYRQYLARGEFPVPRGLVQVYMTRSKKIADFLARRLAVEVGEYRPDVLRRGHVYYFLYHPALREVLDGVMDLLVAKVARSRDPVEVRLGIAPPEYVFVNKALEVHIGEGGGVFAYPNRWVDAVFGVLKSVADKGVSVWGQHVDRSVKDHGPALHAYLKALDRDYRRLWAMYGDYQRALRTYLASRAAAVMFNELVRQAREGRYEALWSWMPGSWGEGILLHLAERAGRRVTLRELEDAPIVVDRVKKWLEWLLADRLAPPGGVDIAFYAAAKLYSEVRGVDVKEVERYALERLRSILRDEAKTAAEELEKAMRQEEKPETLKRTAEEAALKTAEEALKKAAEGEKTAGEGRPPLGFIPERYRGASAVSWLASVKGRVELDREAAEAVNKAVRRAVEKVKARYLERLAKRGGAALVEAAESLARDIYSLIWHAADSPEALHYLAILLDRAEDVVHGLEPRSPVEADAARVFAEVRERFERIRAELGEEAAEEAWRYAYAVGREVIKALISTHEDALKAVATVEQALRLTVFASAAAESIIALHHGLYGEAVVSAVAGALALVEEGRFEKAVEYVKRAAESAYEALREVFEKAKIALERLYELFVEAVARVVAWIDEHKAWLFLAAAVTAGIITWAFAYDVFGSIELGKLALASGLIKYGEFKKPPAVEELVKAAKERNATVGGALEELFKVVNGLSRGAAKVDVATLLNIANQLKEAEGAWLEPTARTLEHWEKGRRSDEERSEYAKAAFLIVWAVLQRRAPEVYERLVEMWNAREEAAAVLRQALVNNDREKWREFYNVLNRLEKAEKSVLRIAEEVERELNAIAVNLKAAAERKGVKALKEVAKWIEVDAREARELAEATQDELSKYSGAGYGIRTVAYLRAVVDDNVVGLTALRAFAAGDLASLVAYTPYSAYGKMLEKAQDVKRGRLGELPLEERLAVELDRVLRYAKEREELRPLVEAFESGEARVEKTEKEGEYVIYAGGMKAVLKLIEGGGAKLRGELTYPLADKKLEEARRAVLMYEEMRREGKAPPPLREAQDGWLLSDVHVSEEWKVITMETASLEQVVTFLSAFGVGAEEIHWGGGEKEEEKVKIYVDYFNVTGEGLRPMYRVELGGEYFKKVWERLSAARSMSEDEKRAFIDFVVRHLEGSRRERLRERLEKWIGEWLAKAPGSKQHRVFHTLVDVFRELAQSEEDAGKREVAKRRAVGILLHAVLGDGSVYPNETRLTVGGGKEDKVPAEVKADLYYALLKSIGYRPRMYKAGGAVYIKLYGDEAKRFAREALPYLAALERMLEAVKSDEQIYSKVEKLIDMARAERVKAWIKDFTTEGKRPRARLVIEADGATAEYQIYLRKDNTVELRFGTTDREEAERRTAVLRAVGVRSEVRRVGNRVEWRIQVTTNALAAESVHEAVRRAVAEFLEKCREAGALGEEAYRRLAAKFERGVPEWGEVRFSVTLRKDGTVVVGFEPSDPQSFSKAVELLRGLGMRDTCEGDWCFVHFTAREPGVGKEGFVRITVDGLRYIGWLALHGEGDVRERAQWLRDMLLKEAEARGVEVRRRLEQYFREGEQWGSVKPPIEKEVEVDGRRVKVRFEEVKAWREKSEKTEHLVVKIRAKVEEEGRETTVEKEARFFKTRSGQIRGYVNIYADAEGGREADYLRTAAVLKALGVESWSRQKKQIRLTGGAVEALMRLEPVFISIHGTRKST
ncbi:hypothetical protein ODS41_11095 [Pyrobaculum sp. 3827-6]|nr:hypothetical protein [Pyrobaculum sp. 3827-6]MCU7788456.1 hypothetical protein [Pyrobaculum sp. 3827-6]